MKAKRKARKHYILVCLFIIIHHFVFMFLAYNSVYLMGLSPIYFQTIIQSTTPTSV